VGQGVPLRDEPRDRKTISDDDPPKISRTLDRRESHRAAAHLGHDPAQRSHDTSRYWTLFAFIAATGTRKGEALGLRWEDVDFAVGSVTIRRTLYRLGGELKTSSPKSATSGRVLYPAPELMAELETARRQQRKDRMLAATRGMTAGSC